MNSEWTIRDHDSQPTASHRVRPGIPLREYAAPRPVESQDDGGVVRSQAMTGQQEQQVREVLERERAERTEHLAGLIDLRAHRSRETGPRVLGLRRTSDESRGELPRATKPLG
jgi:hypothetical protein